ncbi:MAG: hypothetical protein JXC85_01430 [Candidatus Aenigmarchaeota archaeon]|nr:hypothetical protein [Candidatus Aenigmarchaeota archaeon]
MEKILESTEKAFMGEFIRLSPKINELSEILWFVFRMGGSVSSNIITPRFPDASKDLENLVGMGILKEMDAGNEKVVAFSERFETKLINKNLSDINVSDIFDTLVDGYSKDLGKRYKLDELIKRLSTVLSSVITYATPEEPAFLNKVFRSVSEELSGDVTPASLNQAKELLEYYLFKYLGLVQPVGSFAVNLSVKAAQVVGKDPDLVAAYKVRPKGTVAVKKPDKQEGNPAEAGKKDA